MPYSMTTSLPLSTSECTPSLSMAELPVKAAAPNFVSATSTLPASAAHTTNLDEPLLIDRSRPGSRARLSSCECAALFQASTVPASGPEAHSCATGYNTRVRRIWRAAVDAVTPYEAGKPLEALVAELGLDDIVRLSANENPLGPSPRVVEALRREAPRVHLYPDGGSSALRGALAQRLAISPAQIVVGNGADELITLVALAAFDPGDEVLMPEPSFEPYATGANIAGARL